MLIYDNITIGQDVEFLTEENEIYSGTVRYKGGVLGRDGVWIGIEARQPGILTN
jgi:dynactin complex subunit